MGAGPCGARRAFKLEVRRKSITESPRQGSSVEQESVKTQKSTGSSPT